MTLDSVYDEDVFLLARQDERQVLYVYHLADGTLAESLLRCALKYEDHYVPIVCQAAPGMYLIIEGETAVTKTLTGNAVCPGYAIGNTGSQRPDYASAARHMAKVAARKSPFP